MNKSEQIGELAIALSKVQAGLTGAKKDTDNGFFKSKYADLESVWEACRKLLTQNDLCVIQTTDSDERGDYIITTLAHISGQWISGKLRLALVKQDPQSMGSAITYARRYALAAIVGIVQTDDDAEAAMDRTPMKDPIVTNVVHVKKEKTIKFALTAPMCCKALMSESQYHDGWYCKECKAKTHREPS